MKIGEVDIGNIKLDKSSRDDVPRLLMGLQSVYLNKALLKNWTFDKTLPLGKTGILKKITN